MRLLGNSSPVGKSLTHSIVWARTLTDYLMAALIFTTIGVVLILLSPLLLILSLTGERYSSGQILELYTRAEHQSTHGNGTS